MFTEESVDLRHALGTLCPSRGLSSGDHAGNFEHGAAVGISDGPDNLAPQARGLRQGVQVGTDVRVDLLALDVTDEQTLWID